VAPDAPQAPFRTAALIAVDDMTMDHVADGLRPFCSDIGVRRVPTAQAIRGETGEAETSFEPISIATTSVTDLSA